MSESDVRNLADAYLSAIGRRDFATARSYLSDGDFRYRSPVSSYQDADVFISNFERIGPILVKLETRFSCMEGPDACHFFDATLSIGEYVTYPCAQLTKVANGRITRIEVIFDASDYRRMFGD